MSRKAVIWTMAVLAIAASAAWWLYGRGAAVIAATAQPGTAVEIVYATGGVEPVRWAKVASVVRSRIIEVCDCEGKPVAKDAVLARLDDRQAQAQLTELRAREDFAKRELTRVTDLIARGAATTQSFERASMDLRQVQGQISVQIERINDYAITAPMNGIVLRRDGEIGEIAEAGQILFRIGVPKPLQIVAEVNEEDIPRVALDHTVLLRTDAFPDERLTGTVREITPMGDVVTKTYRIKIALADDTPLKPGMSVEANIITREKPNALMVPADAVRDGAVFAIEGTRVRRREVKLGIRGTRQVEILSGLVAGERVASPAIIDIKDGSRVRVTDTKAP